VSVRYAHGFSAVTTRLKTMVDQTALLRRNV
jgi:hypothetical protein